MEVIKPDARLIRSLAEGLDPLVLERVGQAAAKICAAKEKGGRVVVVTGSGPNLHEGVTTLIGELIRLEIVDGVATSSAVIAHEMAGVLDRVKRVDGQELDLPAHLLPLGGQFELSLLEDGELEKISREMPLDWDLIEQVRQLPGERVIKAAGNLGYPMGLWMEHLAGKILNRARDSGQSFEETVQPAVDPRTMLGAAHARRVPVVVTIPQLIGGGRVGLAIGDSVSISERAGRLSGMLAEADVVIESAVALTQEIHDGPFETFTGHGIWAAWQGHPSCSLEGKSLVRIDLDPTLERAWRAQREEGSVQEAIDKGLPKTKLLGVPFRMEMSGFARLPGSIPITGDIGVIWPILTHQVTERLGVEAGFMSYPQETDAGQAMRGWIVDAIRPLDHNKL